MLRISQNFENSKPFSNGYFQIITILYYNLLILVNFNSSVEIKLDKLNFYIKEV